MRRLWPGKLFWGGRMMDKIQAVETVRRKLKQSPSPAIIAVPGMAAFKATLINGGIEVDCLDVHGFLHWTVFREAICVMQRNAGRARIGVGCNARLGDPELPLNSIEGHIAHVVYGRGLGDAVFARAIPVAAILIWAGVCRKEGDFLVLLDKPNAEVC